MSQNVPKIKRCFLVAELASGKSCRQVALENGLNPRTVQRWYRDPALRKSVAEARESLLAAALGRMAGQLETATDTLARALHSEKEVIRLRAARLVLTATFRMRDSVDQNDRVREIERILEEKEGGHAHA